MPQREPSAIGRLIDERDWSASPLGPPAAWPRELRDVMRLILPAQAQIVLFWGEDFIALYNDAYAPTIGDKHPAAFGRPARESWSELWDDLEPLLRGVRETGETVAAKDRPFYIERHGYGEQVYFDISYSPVRDEAGAVLGVLCIVDETTARARLSSSDERLRAATEAADIGVWHIDMRTGALRWDDRCKAIFGLPPDAEPPAREQFLEMLHPDDRERADVASFRAIDPQARPLYDVEYRVRCADGVERWIAAKGRAAFEGDKPVRFVGTVLDITARKQTEIALEVLNATAMKVAADLDLERLVQTVVDAGVELTGAQFGTFFYNVADERHDGGTLYALSGVDRSAFTNFPMPRNTKVFAPTLAGEGILRSDDITKDSRFAQNAAYLRHPEGHLPVRSYLAAPVVSRTGEMIGGLFFGHERVGVFTERAERWLEGLAAQAAIGIDNARLFQDAQRLNQTLAQEVALLAAQRDRVWQVSRDLLGVADLNGIWLSVNPAWTRVLGWTEDELVGRTTAWIGHPDDCAANQSIVARITAGETNLAVVEEGAIYCMARDVTAERERQRELQETQERLRQSQKMESVGQLTGGVAHDFNNLLQIIAGNLDILQRTLPEDAVRQRRAADNAMTGAKRAATLTERLLAFSRRQPLSPKPLNANRLISGMSELLRRSLGETIEIDVVSTAGLWRVEVDPNALENAILNLALNARDAMPEGGKLTIRTANARLDPDDVADQPDMTAGEYVSISVSDTGQGMSDEVIERVFEPFFTTKEVGKGTGLGLSQVYGFVKQSGGHVKIESTLGHGATVRLYLPRLVGGTLEEDEAPAAAAPEPAQAETILVCEDDADVRAYSSEVLRELGYTVLEAADGPSAQRILERGPVDLLFTDVVLPGGMTGASLAEKARRTRPGLKVLFTTGYARNAIVHDGRLDPGVELIPKPFAYADLAARIRHLLDARMG